jgi:hypothetical protein
MLTIPLLLPFKPVFVFAVTVTNLSVESVVLFILALTIFLFELYSTAIVKSSTVA